MTSERERLHNLLADRPGRNDSTLRRTAEMIAPPVRQTVKQAVAVKDTPSPAVETPAVLTVPDEPAPPAASTAPRATLTLPLGRLIDIDGTETVLGEAVVDIDLIPAAVLAILDGTTDAAVNPVTAYVSRRLTPDGEQAIRRLTTYLTAPQ